MLIIIDLILAVKVETRDCTHGVTLTQKFQMNR